MLAGSLFAEHVICPANRSPVAPFVSYCSALDPAARPIADTPIARSVVGFSRGEGV